MKFSSLLAVLAIFILFSLFLFWPIFLGKVNLNGNLLVSFYAPYGENLPFKNSGWDQLRIYFPFYKITLETIKNLEIPLWNPYAFSGHPHLADFQTAVFYPINIFGLFLSQIEFWHLLRITPMILASFFTFLYLRSFTTHVILGSETTPESVVKKDSGQALRLRSGRARMTKKSGGLSPLAAIFGGMTFGFSPFILTWGEEVVMSPHSIVWLPLILWAIEEYLSPSLRHPELDCGSDSRFRENDSKKRKNDKRKYLAVISLATAFSFFGGYMQTSIYMFVFIFAYLIYRFWQNSRGVNIKHLGGDIVSHLRILVSFGLGVGIAAVQLMPAAELFFNAARSEVALREQLFNFLLPLESIFTYLAPDFFGHPATANFFRFGDAQYYEGILFVGVATLIFAGYMLVCEWHRGFVKFLTISGLVALLSVIDWIGARLFLSLPIPFLSTSIPNRVLFIPAFCLAVLAAGGLDRWIKEKFTVAGSQFTVFRSVLVIAGVYAGILVTLLGVRIWEFPYFEQKQFLTEANFLVSLRNLVIPLAVFAAVVVLIAAAYFWRLGKQAAAVAIIGVSFLHIFYFSQKYFSFSDRDKIFPENAILGFIRESQGYFRSWGVGNARFENNFASQYSLYWPEGYDSLNNRSYGEFTYSMQGASLEDFIFRADAGLGYGSTAQLIENKNRRRLIDMVGVKYVIGLSGEEQVMSQNNFKKVFDPPAGGGKYAVYENLTVMPRVFLASNYEGPPDVFGEEPKTEEERLQREKLRRKLIPQKLLGDDFDWRNVVILEKPSPISAQFGEGDAEIISYKPQEVFVRTNSSQPKLLFLSDNWYPGWKASVDGDETEIFRANYTFRAVPLVPGVHEVRFYYDSSIFKVGLAISIVSLAALMVLVFNGRKLIS